MGSDPSDCLIGFKIAQPLLLNRVIQYLSSAVAEDNAVGRVLVGATVLIYVGTAVCSDIRQRHELS